MKYNKSEIMKRAHELRKDGKDMSRSLKISWSEAKLELANDQLFALEMIDYPNVEENEAIKEINKKCAEFEKIINADVVMYEKKVNKSLSDDEAEELLMQRIVLRNRYGSFSNTHDYFAELEKIEKKLFVMVEVKAA